jgi:hypothetical protein
MGQSELEEATMVPRGVLADGVLDRIRAEYLEMPGLRVNAAPARRLWGLEAVACEQALEVLQDVEFLKRLADGTFVRSDST